MITYTKDIINEHKKFFSDCKHMSWLFKMMIVNFLKGNLHEAQESYYWMRIHWNYKSRKINH